MAIMPRVSVVIPTYNMAQYVSEAIQSVLEQTFADLEVIVVDDGSTDATADVAGSYPIRYVYQVQKGPAAARNQGARLATGAIVAFTDADCVPGRQWAANLVDGFDEDEDVVGVGGAYGIANAGSFLARLVHAEIQERHTRLGDAVDFLGSFNVAYRKDVFWAAGGFDETFTAASGEDNDLAYRLGDLGGRLRFVRNAPVAHYHPAHLWPYLRAQMRHGYWRMKLYRIHPGRLGGDAYAPLRDLAAVPVSALALLTCISVVLLHVVRMWHRGVVPVLVTSDILFAASLAAYVSLRAPMALRMMRRTGERALIVYVGVAFLRDLARFAGMVRGVWRFGMGRERP